MDRLSPQQRHENMAAIHGKDTKPEMVVKGETMMQAPLHHFEKSWNDPEIVKHTWKRFATMAKEEEKKWKRMRTE